MTKDCSPDLGSILQSDWSGRYLHLRGRVRLTSSRDEEDTNGDGVVNEDDAVDEDSTQDIVEGTTVQLPTFAFTSVSTTVSVPMVVRSCSAVSSVKQKVVERGIPVLSKIPCESTVPKRFCWTIQAA